MPERNHTDSPQARHIPMAAAARLHPAAGALSSLAFEHGTMALRWYSPAGTDVQKPHTRDEIYFVASGSGVFVNGDARHQFATGDALFVPAGVTHRFEAFSPDFAVFVVFYGPEGGETA